MRLPDEECLEDRNGLSVNLVFLYRIEFDEVMSKRNSKRPSHLLDYELDDVDAEVVTTDVVPDQDRRKAANTTSRRKQRYFKFHCSLCSFN